MQSIQTKLRGFTAIQSKRTQSLIPDPDQDICAVPGHGHEQDTLKCMQMTQVLTSKDRPISTHIRPPIVQ